jgi:hypothetical protein
MTTKDGKLPRLELEPLDPDVLARRKREVETRVFFARSLEPATKFGVPTAKLLGPADHVRRRLDQDPEFRNGNPDLAALLDEAGDLDEALRQGESFYPDAVQGRRKDRFVIKRMPDDAKRRRRLDIDERLSDALHGQPAPSAFADSPNGEHDFGSGFERNAKLILDAIAAKGCDAKALRKRPGKQLGSPVKGEIRKLLVECSPPRMTESQFLNTWKALHKQGRIGEA